MTRSKHILSGLAARLMVNYESRTSSKVANQGPDLVFHYGTRAEWRDRHSY